MKYGINTLDDFDLRSKSILARLDLNSPYGRKEKKLKDITRIVKAIPTIRELSEAGAKLTIMSHQGGDLEYQNFISTRLHSEVISGLLGKNVTFIDDVCGPAARDAIKTLKNGNILLLDNVRYMAEEMTLFERKLRLSPEEQAKTVVVRKLAPLIDIYVCDGFAAAHRNQPTLVGFEELMPSAMGRLFEKEYEILSNIMSSPRHPVIFLLGGAKIEDAFNMMPKVLGEGIADKILATGLLAQLFLLAKGVNIGEPSKEIIFARKLDDFLDEAKDILSKYGNRIITPQDFAFFENGRVEIGLDRLPSRAAISDIGTRTVSQYKEEISGAKTIFVNGPAGVFEKKATELGTKELLSHIAKSNSFSVIGGGDSISAVNKYSLKEGFSYMCTGGGAMVRFLSGEELPVVSALKRSANRFKI